MQLRFLDIVLKCFSFFILIFFLGIACRKRTNDCPGTQQYQQLTSSSKEWLPYTSNRLLIFESSSSATDTLELKNRFSGTDDVWLGDACEMSKGEFLRADIIDRKSNDTINTQIGYGDQVLIEKRNGYILYYDTKGVLILASQHRRFETSITLNGKTYTSVLVFECSPNDKCVSTGITKFYFSKGVGLVAFERNGTLWTLRG